MLFVGCAWYAHRYERLLPGRDYWTIDPDPWKRRFGARRHVVAEFERLDAHVARGSFDLIVCNGVFGWGLDDRVDCERAFAPASTRSGRRANLSSAGTTFRNTGRSTWPVSTPWGAFIH